MLSALRIEPEIIQKVKILQESDPEILKVKDVVSLGKRPEFQVSEDGVVRCQGRLCVPDGKELKKEILSEAHRSNYSVHPGSTKMYRNLRQQFWWNGMKADTVKHVSQCLTCQQVKAKHRKPAGLLRPLDILEWKWEHITMDFVQGLPRTSSGHDSIWVIVDRLTKSAHFLAVRIDYPMDKYADIYM